MRDDRERLRDILEAVERIDRYADEGQPEFEHNELIQVWVIHHLEIIGETARKISTELQGAAADVPWTQVKAMRNILVHEYFGIDLNEVWRTVQHDLPEPERRIRELLQRLESAPDD